MKQSIRAKIIKQRNGLNQSQKKEWDNSLVQCLKELINDLGIKSVLAFYPLVSEPNIIGLLEWLLSSGIKVYLPQIGGSGSDLAKVTNLDSLVKNSMGFMEPSEIDETKKQDFGLVIVPAIGLNPQNGHRIGYGGGFYDKILKKVSGLKVGIGYEFQLNSDWVAEPHDVALDMIVTPNGVYRI